jgi:uncharacterized protein (DUF2062 family)
MLIFSLPTLVSLPKFHWKTITMRSSADTIDIVTMNAIKQKVATWLRQGISPQRLALTLALGFAIGCFPIVGVTTAICLVVATSLRLNLPAIQAANWVAMPFQVALIVPFVRLGGRLFGLGSGHAIAAGSLLHAPTFAMVSSMGWLAGEALLAWVVIAVPAVLLMTATLTVLLRHVPAVVAAESANKPHFAA